MRNRGVWHAIWLLAVCLLSATAARAQATDSVAAQPVPAWTKVRIRAPLVSARWVAGQLVRADSDSVVLERGRKGSLVVPRWQVERLQVAAGRNHVAGAARGLVLGTLVMAVPLSIISQLEPRAYNGEADAVTVIGGTALGAVIGLLTGAATGVQEWRKVPLPSQRSGQQLQPAGAPSTSTDTEMRDGMTGTRLTPVVLQQFSASSAASREAAVPRLPVQSSSAAPLHRPDS